MLLNEQLSFLPQCCSVSCAMTLVHLKGKSLSVTFKGLPPFDIPQPGRRHALVNWHLVWSLSATIVREGWGAPGSSWEGSLEPKDPQRGYRTHSAQAGLRNRMGVPVNVSCMKRAARASLGAQW